MHLIDIDDIEQSEDMTNLNKVIQTNFKCDHCEYFSQNKHDMKSHMTINHVEYKYDKNNHSIMDNLSENDDEDDLDNDDEHNDEDQNCHNLANFQARRSRFCMV